MGFKFPKIFKKEPPINGGNTFETQIKINAREEQIESYVDLNFGKIKLNHYTWWELLQFQADYFTNLFPITFNDQYIDQVIQIIFRCNFLYGNVGILVKEDKLIPIVEAVTDLNIDGSIKRIEGYSAFEVVLYEGTIKDNQNNYKNKVIINKSNMENYVRLSVNSYGFGAIVKWWKFVNNQEKVIKKINNFSVLFNKKVGYNVNSVTAAKQELQSFFNDDTPFIVNASKLNVNGNKFSVDGFENIKSTDLFEYYDKWLKMNYELLGRRLNVDKKGERNITSEVNASQGNFDVLEYEQKINKTNFLNSLSKIISKDWKVFDKEDREADKKVNQVNQQDQKDNGREVGEVENEL